MQEKPVVNINFDKDNFKLAFSGTISLEDFENILKFAQGLGFDTWNNWTEADCVVFSKR